jgi:hypothetical protein
LQRLGRLRRLVSQRRACGQKSRQNHQPDRP